MLRAELLQVRNARHGPVVVHDFADDAARPESCQPRQIDHRLSLSGANENAAFAGAQWKDVAWTYQVRGLARRIDSHLNGPGAVGGGDASGDSFGGLDRFGERSAQPRGVSRRHLRQME